MSLHHAAPNSTFDLWVNEAPGACPLASATKTAALTTNAHGDGKVQVQTALVAGATEFWVSVTSASQTFRTPAAALAPHKH